MSDDLRPEGWDQYIGQELLKEKLRIHIQGALSRKEPLENVLLFGPKGCGKTSLASLIAQELSLDFESFVMPIKPSAIQRIVHLFDGVVLFDEIHRLSDSQQESLLPLIEDGYLQLENGGRIYSDCLTVVGATTELHKVIGPLYDRFQISPQFGLVFEEYTDTEMGKIVMNMAVKQGVDISPETAIELGRATGGVPRNAKAIINMARDLQSTDTDEILDKCRLTKDGLSELHLRYVKSLASMGGVAGIDILGAHLQLPKPSLVDLEKLLVKRGLLEYTSKGRSLLGPAYKLIGKKYMT